MTKKEFLQELRSRLSAYPKEELDRSIGYWSEMVEDRMEDGATEDEAVASLGSIDDIAKQIEMELPLKTIIKHSVKDKSSADEQKKDNTGITVLVVVLAILAFPIWFPIAIALISIIAALFITIWAIDFALWVCSLSGVICFFAGLIFAVALLIGGHGILALSGFGTSLAGAGIAILFAFAAFYMAKGIIKLIDLMCRGTKRSIVNNKRR